MEDDRFEQMLKLQNMIREELKELKTDMERRFENQGRQMASLWSAVEPLERNFTNQRRDVEKLGLDMKVALEHGRREAGIGRYRKAFPQDTETDGSGHSSYPWIQRPATPRPG
ncbi:MAG TPA: hypothetical protein VK591_16715 [Xanthobacteraceae bacterium]|nr:hypothetical protein [Xanthobacteraceae bacterium]